MIYNKSSNLYLIASSSEMLSDINKQFYGLMNKNVHTDYASGAELQVTLFPLERSRFDTFEGLEQNIREFYGITPETDYETDWSQSDSAGKKGQHKEFAHTFSWESIKSAEKA